jgi:uncharacterized protein (DUF4415 family)
VVESLIYWFRIPKGARHQPSQSEQKRDQPLWPPNQDFDPKLHDENPEWTQQDFAKAKPASEVLPPEVMAQFKNKGGRPRIENPKEAVKLRIDADVLAKFRESGRGWQTRINGILRAAVSVHAPRAEGMPAAKRTVKKSTSTKKHARPKTAGKSGVQPEKRRHIS